MTLRPIPLLLAAVLLAPSLNARVGSSRAAAHVRITLLPPGASGSGPTFIGDSYIAPGDPINSNGIVALHAGYGSNCGDQRAFTYFPDSGKYFVIGNPPNVSAANAAPFGVTNDNNVGLVAFDCATKRTSLYLVGNTDTSPTWSQPCTCAGYSPVGVNSDGVALNNRKRGPAILTFPGTAPNVTPVLTNVGPAAKAHLWAAGSPSGFVGSQRDTKTGKDVPSVWLNGVPYLLPFVHTKYGPPLALAMFEHQNAAGGLQIGVVGVYRSVAGPDYWIGHQTASGFVFSEKRGYIDSPNMGFAYGVSTDGAVVFGDLFGDYDTLLAYYTASRKTSRDGRACRHPGQAFGDSRGDILVITDGGTTACYSESK